MNQEKIGKLIAKMRKNKKLTQSELANMLGVTDKSVSKWETGKCLPDVSLYKNICEILDISLNEFFAGEKISEENYKEVADKNLFMALENSVFTLKDKVGYFKNKWQKDHFFELTIESIVLVFLIVYCCIKQKDLVFLTIILSFIWSILQNNRMMTYIEKNAYGPKTNISIEEFCNSIERLRSTKELLEKFNSRNEAINYLIRETKLSAKECSNAYDFIIKLN